MRLLSIVLAAAAISRRSESLLSQTTSAERSTLGAREFGAGLEGHGGFAPAFDTACANST